MFFLIEIQVFYPHTSGEHCGAKNRRTARMKNAWKRSDLLSFILPHPPEDEKKKKKKNCGAKSLGLIYSFLRDANPAWNG